VLIAGASAGQASSFTLQKQEVGHGVLGDMMSLTLTAPGSLENGGALHGPDTEMELPLLP
jgi:hypothetical protein